MGFGLIIRNNLGEVLVATCDRTKKKLNTLGIVACVMRKAQLFCQNISFSKVQLEYNFTELVDLLNSDRTCSLEVAWIFEDIQLLEIVLFLFLLLVLFYDIIMLH